MLYPNSFIAKLLNRSREFIFDLYIHFLNPFKDDISGYYNYTNTYDNAKEFQSNSGFVMIVQFGSKLYFSGGFSDLSSKEDENRFSIWHSTLSNSAVDYIYNIEYQITVYDGNNASSHTVISSEDIHISEFDRKQRPKVLIGKFNSPHKGTGKCIYKRKERSLYMDAKTMFDEKVKI